jgi:micrococcal nuclease
LGDRGKLFAFSVLSTFLLFVIFIIPLQITYGNNFNKLSPLLQDNDIVYADFERGSQSFVSQMSNQTTANGVELAGNVSYVVDGDTLDINGIRVRLSLVDTPERGQPGFKEAKEFVKSLCLGKNGEFDVDNGQRRGDRFGREIGVVYCNGVNINEKLMDSHLANTLTEYCDISEFSNEKWAKSDCSLEPDHDNDDKEMVDQGKALAFIKSMYNPSVGMLREAPGFDRYWLWSDQLLGQLILKAVDPALAAKIETKMLSYKIPMKNLWATLDPKYRENFSAGGTKEIKVSGTSNIWYSDYGGNDIPCTSHADVAFLTAIHLHYSGDKNGALSCYNAGKSMWDGNGMKDRGQITGDYAVYKVALGLLAEKILNAPPIGIAGNYFDKFQASNGGITTDLTGGVPKGSQNIETTFAVLVALNPSLLEGAAAGDFGCSENEKNTVKNMEDDKLELVLPLGNLSYQSTPNC